MPDFKMPSDRRLKAQSGPMSPPRPATPGWSAPHPDDEFGLVALDFELTPARVISAYRHGIFPWPDGNPRHPIPWVCPPQRGILEFARLHIPHGLRKAQRHCAALRFTLDGAFEAVIRACAAANRPGQARTWITPPMIDVYTQVHRLGEAHSVEAWDGDALVAGLYGISAGGVFAGESMFTHIADGSKLCLLHLIAHLRTHGATWLDIQQLTPHFAALGARAIPRPEFLARLAAEQRQARVLFPPTAPPSSRPGCTPAQSQSASAD